METVAFHTTVGLLASHANFDKDKLVRVNFDVKDDDSVNVYAVSGHSLSKLRNVKSLTITRDQLANLDDDPCNDMVFARAAFDLLDLRISE